MAIPKCRRRERSLRGVQVKERDGELGRWGGDGHCFVAVRWGMEEEVHVGREPASC